MCTKAACTTCAATCSGLRRNLQAQGDPRACATCRRGPFREWSVGGLHQWAHRVLHVLLAIGV
eukprot:11709144-Alexandrium_andersonii.AAC.1